MVLKTYNPITPSQRELILVDKSLIWKGKPLKKLTKGLSKTGGRNNLGRITSRHIGGGHKRSYRIIDFKRTLNDKVAKVERIEYDPNRTSYIALIKYEDGLKSYIIAPEKLSVGNEVVSGKHVDIKTGNALPMQNIPVGILLHNIEMKPGKGGQLARSAGCYAQLVGKDNGFALLKLKSGELRKIKLECIATIGSVSNSDHQNINYGKAGRMRWLGRRSSVRGVAMNPIDHPHGGGEGKTSGGRHPVSPWGQSAKGKRTRSNKSTNKFIIKRRYAK